MVLLVEQTPRQTAFDRLNNGLLPVSAAAAAAAVGHTVTDIPVHWHQA
jgi:hypothetical protein